jgi:acyl-CoA thioester hydrolase
MSGSPPISAEVRVKAQFFDLDPMNVVWHGNYPRYLEQARCALLDRIGFNYGEMQKTDHVWPIVDMRIKYVRPIRFGQDVLVRATLSEHENRLRIDYLIVDAGSGDVLTRAQTIQVAVRRETQELEYASPPALLDAVRKAQS